MLDFRLCRRFGRTAVYIALFLVPAMCAPNDHAQGLTPESPQVCPQRLSSSSTLAGSPPSADSKNARCQTVSATDASPGQASDPTSNSFSAPIPDSANADSLTNGPNDWIHRWMRAADKALADEPKDAAPLITTHVALAQLVRFDSYYQTAKGYETQEYGAMKGLELIPNSHFEVQVSPPPYFYRQAPFMPDGWGDVSIFLKFKVASAPDARGGYFFGFFLGGQFPSGTVPNGKGHTIWTPAVGGSKTLGFFRLAVHPWRKSTAERHARAWSRTRFQQYVPVQHFQQNLAGSRRQRHVSCRRTKLRQETEFPHSGSHPWVVSGWRTFALRDRRRNPDRYHRLLHVQPPLDLDGTVSLLTAGAISQLHACCATVLRHQQHA